MNRVVLVLLTIVACAPVAPRFPADVQTAIAHDDMRRLETERFIIYYPAARRALVDRFLVRADRCAAAVRHHAVKKDLAKMVILMPDAAFNNAFVAPSALGYEEVSVIPTFATLDFTTSFGLPPDPGAIACHELVHYVHFQQTRGFWGTFNEWFGPMYTPQLGYDPWVAEGIATHYEARLSPGLGRPVWPIFTGMFAAAYAGRDIDSGELSAFGRSSPVGHHYLVGSMFIRFLVERYGERPLWLTLDNQAGAWLGWFFTGTFKEAYGVSFGDLVDEFGVWVKRTFPTRTRPATQRTLGVIGNDARYARGRDGTEAWVAEDVDAPPRLTVKGARGETLLDTALVEIVPPRTLMLGDPLLTSGLSITADGREVWFTAIDLGPTFQVARLMRWRRGERSPEEVARNLGPGATIDPSGRVYYYCEVDGDRWSLAAWDVQTRAKRKLVDMQPGTFVLGAQVSADGKLLAANVWDGTAFVVWVIDAATGARVREVRGNGTPVFDGSFASDGRLMYLGVVDGRFQVFVDGDRASDAPYAALAAREAGGTIRFLDRERWSWELAEITTPLRLPAPPPPPPAPAPQPEQPPAPAEQPPSPPEQTTTVEQPPATAVAPPPPAVAPAPPAVAPAPPAPAPPPSTPTASLYPATPLPTPPGSSVRVLSDEPYSAFERLFFPQVRSPTLAFGGGVPHIGLVLGGGDRLMLQRWYLAGYVQPGTGDNPSHYGARAGYLNNMLAPVFMLGEGGFLDWAAPFVIENDPMDPDDDVTITEEHRTRDAYLAIGYTYRGSLTALLGGLYTDDRYQFEGSPAARRNVAGPSLTLQWVSAETTRYTGPRRAILVDTQLAYYPNTLSSFDANITDIAGGFGLVVPVPLGRRHTLSGFVRGRALVAPGEVGLLQVGGDTTLGILWDRRSVSTMPPEYDDTGFPVGLRFVEPLRGYEDFAITSDRVTLGELAWKYPLIVDRGTAALWFLPAAYIRQLDLELFAAGAITDGDDKHYAIGAALSARIQFLRLPLVVTYQIARRLVDDEALAQLVGIGADI